MIYCTSGDTVKCVVVRLTLGMYSSCLHSMTKERPCEEERSQMNAARNGKLPRVQQHKCVLLAFASVCIRSLGLVGRQTQKALKVLLSSFLQPPGPPESPADTRNSLFVFQLQVGKQREGRKGPGYVHKTSLW